MGKTGVGPPPTRRINEVPIEYGIIGEGSQFSTNQKRESTVSWLLIGRNL